MHQDPLPLHRILQHSKNDAGGAGTAQVVEDDQIALAMALSLQQQELDERKRSGSGPGVVLEIKVRKIDEEGFNDFDPLSPKLSVVKLTLGDNVRQLAKHLAKRHNVDADQIVMVQAKEIMKHDRLLAEYDLIYEIKYRIVEEFEEEQEEDDEEEESSSAEDSD